MLATHALGMMLWAMIGWTTHSPTNSGASTRKFSQNKDPAESLHISISTGAQPKPKREAKQQNPKRSAGMQWVNSSTSGVLTLVVASSLKAGSKQCPARTCMHATWWVPSSEITRGEMSSTNRRVRVSTLATNQAVHEHGAWLNEHNDEHL